MPRSAGQKAKLLYLLRIFERRTDPEHLLSVPQLAELLEAEGMQAERKSIYSDITALQDAGYDIEQVRGRRGGYCLADRPFQLAELKLLVDAVQASRFITRKKSEQLIKKLEGLASDHQGRQLQRQVVVSGRVKTMNESIYYLVDDLHTAISGDRQVTFQYYDWDIHKNKAPRKGGALYQVSPWALAWENDNYYLIAHDGTGIRHYRVDKMAKLSVTGERRLGKESFARFDAAAYAKKMFGMFGGSEQRVRLRCRNSLVGPILDRFGTEVMLLPQEDGAHFDLWVDAVVSPQFLGWVCGFGGEVEVMEPPGARAEMARLARQLAGQYGG